MPRPPSPESRQVRLLTFLRTMRYELPDDRCEFDLILRTLLTGPLREPVPEPPDGRRIERDGMESREILELRTQRTMAEDDVRRHLARLKSEATVQIPMEFGRFESDWTDDHGLHDLDLSGNVRLHYDKLGRLRADATFDQDWVVGFGKRLVGTQLCELEIRHADIRLWHILSHLSPQLDKELRAATGAAQAPLRYPLVETVKAATGAYYRVGPPEGWTVNDSRYRDGLLNALVDDMTICSKAEICIIFGQESAHDDSPTKEGVLIHPARDVTITRMMSEAGLKPIFGKFYDARQITHILVPFAVAHREGTRYVDLKETLIDTGISVPDNPMT